MSKSWQFLCNYSEKEAYFVKKPFKPIKLIDFFKNEDVWATHPEQVLGNKLQGPYQLGC